jgi:hypothetical protein
MRRRRKKVYLIMRSKVTVIKGKNSLGKGFTLKVVLSLSVFISRLIVV